MMNAGTIFRWYEITRRTMLLAVAALVLVCGLTVFLDAPELIPAVAIPCMAWFAWRVYRVSTLGIVLCVVALELVTGIASLVYHSVGSIGDFIPAALLFVSALGCMLASVVTFLVRAYISPVQPRLNLVAAAAACLLPTVWFAVGPRGAGILSEWALQREIARSGLPALTAEVTAVAQRLGRAPQDEAELVRLLGKPMPRISRGWIRYRPSGGKHFKLSFGYDAGCYEFNSQKPEQGWRWAA